MKWEGIKLTNGEMIVRMPVLTNNLSTTLPRQRISRNEDQQCEHKGHVRIEADNPY